MRALKYKKVIAVVFGISMIILSFITSIMLYYELLDDLESWRAGIVSSLVAFMFTFFGVSIATIMYYE
jgi:hypothetical protein